MAVNHLSGSDPGPPTDTPAQENRNKTKEATVSLVNLLMVLLNCFSFLMESNIVARNFSKVLSESHGRAVQSRRRCAGCGLPTLAVEGQDHDATIPAFAALKAEFADIRVGSLPGLPPIELVLEAGNSNR